MATAPPNNAHHSGHPLIDDTGYHKLNTTHMPSKMEREKKLSWGLST